jgi:ATP-dependent DNA helicase UvrD/PcrA
MAVQSERATGTLDGIGVQDHSATSEYRIVGPPGTGKTTNTGRQVERAVQKYGPGSVLVTSFSRAAAAELANCDLTVNPDRIGTLHSFCFHALGKPRIAEAHVEEWNALHPQLALTPVKGQCRLDGEDPAEDDSSQRAGDSLLRELNRRRGLMTNPDAWPGDLVEFERKWSRYKRERGLMDFSDLIDTCLRDISIAPGKPAVIFADEAQDLSIMQARLIRKWGSHGEYFVTAGDDDQAIFAFIGATPEAILESEIPENHTVILRESHRVPRAVHQLANGLIQRVTRRQAKAYFPRPAAGDVQRLSSGTYKTPEYAILTSAVKHLERGKEVMFLASCSYMLGPIIQVLRKNAIPFHNPYRKSNGFWNPMRVTSQSVSRRILALLAAHPAYGEGQRQWTNHDLVLWTALLRENGVLKAGVREVLQSADGREPVTMERLAQLLEPAAFSSMMVAFNSEGRALLDWWRSNVGPSNQSRIQYPASIVVRHGPQALVEEPSVVVGTIHSVKGGQADVVYLFPDLSRAGDAQYQVAGAPRDSVIRLFYVGATRARETLYICGSATPLAISI